MAMEVKELIRWLQTLDKDDVVYIDEGGLTLRSMMESDVYNEVGGEPEGEDDDE